MPRQARLKSSTGIYHIMLRGIDKRDIFLEDEDKIRFLDSVIKAKEVGNFELYGYCLMDNHVHMLIKENEEIGTSIKRITVGYVGWHNKKYERTGHLFQNRYLSEPVATERYLLTVLKYIHQNPVKANMVDNIGEYRWSSFREYDLSYNGQNSIIDLDLIKSYLSTLNELKTLEKRNLTKEIYNKKNTSIRQLSRVFSVGKTIVEKAVKKDS